MKKTAANKLSSEYRIPIRYHVLFWVIYFIFNFLRFGSLNNDYWYSFKSNLVEFPLNIAITYFTIYFLVPRFILKKKFFRFFLFFSVSLIFFYLVRTGLNYLLVTQHIWPEYRGNSGAFTFNHIVEVTVGIVYVIGFVAAIKFTFDWINERRKKEELQKIQLQTELNFLKTQIQPHFFFNTLNNLYALTLEKSDAAPDVVLKLSEIMQYVLYDTRERRIFLSKEIHFIHSYLDLEKLRYEDRVEITTEIKGKVDNIKVPSLIFLTFIENCFKHGSTDSKHFKVHILFDIRKEFLYFTVSNTFNPDSRIPTKQGIGIENAKRRLQLVYGDRYQLTNEVKDNRYIVHLKLPINDN